jgi:SAM-dependent methyltransferase
MLAKLAERRDIVLDRARLERGEALLDVGCGEGLIGFGALERGAARVIFADISDDVLDVCRSIAADLAAGDRCSFVNASADGLVGIDDASVDVVTTRSVLIYVSDKAAAFRAFARVLRPGGRISLFEPINRFGMDERRRGLWGYPTDGVGELAQRVEAIFEDLQPPSDPMLDFDERDLVRHAEAAGFFPIELDYHADITTTEPKPWAAFVKSSGNPKIPTLGEAMERALTPEEVERLAAHLRPLVETGGGVWRMGEAYLTAFKP